MIDHNNDGAMVSTKFPQQFMLLIVLACMEGWGITYTTSVSSENGKAATGDSEQGYSEQGDSETE